MLKIFNLSRVKVAKMEYSFIPVLIYGFMWINGYLSGVNATPGWFKKTANPKFGLKDL